MMFDRRFFALVVLLCVSAVRSTEDASDDELNYEMDEGVVVLTDKNFDAFLKKNPSVLVKFYAPW